MFRFLVVFVFTFNILNAYCSEPSEPYCVSSRYTYEDDYRFKSCKRNVENYLQELAEYAQCVANEAQKNAQETIKKFNCYASGKSYCY